MSHEHKPQVPPELGPLPDEQDLEQWLAPLRTEYQRGFVGRADGRDSDEQRARRGRHVQHLASLIRKAPLQQKSRVRRTWGVIFAAASVLGVIAGSTLIGQNHSTTLATAPSVPAAAVLTADLAAQPAADQATPTAGASLRQVVGRVVATHADGQPELASVNAGFAAGDEVSTTAESFASLDVGRSRVDLASASTLKLLKVELFDQAFQLNAGRVDLSIPRVPGETRSVQVLTADTVVSVKGTVFSVEVVHQDEHLATVVQVTRGLVAVSSHGQEHLVHPGETWSSAGSAAGVPQAPLERNAEAPAEPSAASKSSRAARTRADNAKQARLSANAAAASSLAEQNALFARALEARDAGNDTQAKASLDELLRRFPGSPLRSSALTERAAVNKRLDQSAQH